MYCSLSKQIIIFHLFSFSFFLFQNTQTLSFHYNFSTLGIFFISIIRIKLSVIRATSGTYYYFKERVNLECLTEFYILPFFVCLIHFLHPKFRYTDLQIIIERKYLLHDVSRVHIFHQKIQDSKYSFRVQTLFSPLNHEGVEGKHEHLVISGQMKHRM